MEKIQSNHIRRILYTFGTPNGTCPSTLTGIDRGRELCSGHNPQALMVEVKLRPCRVGFKLASLQTGQPENSTIGGQRNLHVREEGFRCRARVEGLLHTACERGVDTGVVLAQIRTAATTVALV